MNFVVRFMRNMMRFILCNYNNIVGSFRIIRSLSLFFITLATDRTYLIIIRIMIVQPVWVELLIIFFYIVFFSSHEKKV